MCGVCARFWYWACRHQAVPAVQWTEHLFTVVDECVPPPPAGQLSCTKTATARRVKCQPLRLLRTSQGCSKARGGVTTAVLRCAVLCSGNMVRRSMNRPPQEADCRAYSRAAAAAAPGGGYCRDSRCWFHAHVRTCGGLYEKVRHRHNAGQADCARAYAKTSAPLLPACRPQQHSRTALDHLLASAGCASAVCLFTAAAREVSVKLLQARWFVVVWCACLTLSISPSFPPAITDC